MIRALKQVFRKSIVRSIFKDIQAENVDLFARLESALKSECTASALRQDEILGQLRQIDDSIKAMNASPDEALCPAAEDSYLRDNPEVGLMLFLYSFLPERTAIDIGANVGEVSERLLAQGYDVYAFEPFPPVFAQLQSRLAQNPGFHAFQMAIGKTDQTLELRVAEDFSGGKFGDTTVFNTLLPRGGDGDLRFTRSVEVPVRSLESLHRAGEVPAQVGLVKIDTEGFDLEVLRGMGSHRYPVVCAEFWGEKVSIGGGTTFNRLKDLEQEMRTQEYHWFIVVYHIEELADCWFLSNSTAVSSRAWGNVFFFRDFATFRQAADWCTAVLGAEIQGNAFARAT